MSKFHKQNHTFRTIDLFGLVALVGVTGTVFGAILAQALQDDRPQRARFMAEALGKQLYSQHVRANLPRPENQRGPASAQIPAPTPLTSGRIGSDPWGRPFHYLVRTSIEKGSAGKIFVWSDGPNGESDTPLSVFEASQAHLFVPYGDDVGSVEEIPEKN